MNYKLRHLVAATLAGTALLGFGANAFADTTDDIVNALIAKGVLTEEEGQLLINSRELEKTARAKVPAPKFKDGLVFENEDKSTTFQIGGRIHADYRTFDHGNNENQTTGNTSNESDTFDIRRARLEFKGHFYDNFDFLLSADAAGQTNGNTGAILDQAWLNISHYKPVQFRVGQFKVPMSMERKMSSNALDFMERSQHDTISTYEDRGAMIWGVPNDGVTYALAVVNGEGNKNRNDTDSRVSKPEFQANATVNFAQLMDNKDAVYHLGFGASTTDISKTGNLAGFPTPNNNTLWFAGGNQARTEARGVNYLALPSIGSAANVSNEISRQRYNLEAAVAYGPVKVVAEYLKNDFRGDLTTAKSFDNSVKAYYASVLWNISGEKFADFYKEGIFTAVKPKNNFDFTKFTGGAWQLGARYSKFDASDFNNSTFVGATAANNVARVATNTATSTNTFEADAYTLGLNYVPNPNVRFMLNYIKTNFDTPILIEGAKEDSESAITARAQFTF